MVEQDDHKDTEAPVDDPRSQNPLPHLRSEQSMMAAARCGLLSALIIVSGSIWALVFGMAGAFGQVKMLVIATSCLAICTAVYLGWWIERRQSIWASVLLLLWVLIETVAKIQLMARPDSQLSASSLTLNTYAGLAAIVSVWGSIRLSLFRRTQAKESGQPRQAQ